MRLVAAEGGVLPLFAAFEAISSVLCVYGESMKVKKSWRGSRSDAGRGNHKQIKGPKAKRQPKPL